MKYNKIYLGVILASLMIGVVVAQDIAEQYPSSLEIFFNNLKHAFNMGQFSVVGDDKGCGLPGGNPNKEWRNLQSGEDFMSTASSECSSGTGLYNVFTNGWTPYKEYKDFVHIQCATPPCNIQLYCCPKLTCSDPVTVNCPQWSGKPSGFYKCPNEKDIPYDKSSYEYCPVEETMTCYYRDGDSCGSRTYDKELFSNSCEDYTYRDGKLYSSESVCEGQLGECVVDIECPSNKPICEGGVCVSAPVGECTTGEDKCIGTTYYECENENWVNKGENIEKCPVADCLANGELNLPGGKDCCSGCQKNWVCVECEEARLKCWDYSTTLEKCIEQPEFLTTKTCEELGKFDDESACTLFYTGGQEYVGTDATARQKGLTKSQIRTATTTEIMGSICIQSNQCDSESQCNSLQSLVEKEVLTDIQARDVAKAVSTRISVATGISGGISAALVCGVIAGPATGPAAIPICAAVGLATGLGLDTLFDSLAEEKLEKTGICVISGADLDAYFGWAAFFDITRDGAKDGTDGLIITLIGGFVIFLLMRKW